MTRVALVFQQEQQTKEKAPAELWANHAIMGFLLYFFTSLVVALGIGFGHDFLQLADHSLASRQDLVKAFANWDGQWYEKIITHGYQYDPDTQSSVAFFPAFPFFGWLLTGTGLRPDLALMLVANFSLAAAFVVLAAYVRQRFPSSCSELGPFVLLAFGFFPTTFFCRMAYSESLFILSTILALYGMERRWPLLAIACIVGFATATRSVGVGLLFPLLFHMRKESRGIKGLAQRLWLMPIACWGIAAYSAYLYVVFDAPFAFVQTQANWRMRPPVSLGTKIFDLATLDPLTANFERTSPCYWSISGGETNELFSLYLANPVYWVGAAGLVIFGAYKRWLSINEISLACCLLFIPYVLRSHEMCMAGMGRFASVAFPVYLVLGHILVRLPRPFTICFFGIASFFLGTYAALFAAWYRFF